MGGGWLAAVLRLLGMGGGAFAGAPAAGTLTLTAAAAGALTLTAAGGGTLTLTRLAAGALTVE